MNMRSEALAQRVLEGHQRLFSFIEDCSQEEWETFVPNEERQVGVVVHHVANMLPVEVDFIKTLAAGKAISGISSDEVDQMNAQHAVENVSRTKEETLALLKQNSEITIAAIRELTDEQLDRAATVSLHWDIPLTTQYFIEDHPLTHSYQHLGSIRDALGD
jgi:hypothetical protein